MDNAGAIGFNPMTFADQDEYLDKFGYNDGGMYLIFTIVFPSK